MKRLDLLGLDRNVIVGHLHGVIPVIAVKVKVSVQVEVIAKARGAGTMGHRCALESVLHLLKLFLEIGVLLAKLASLDGMVTNHIFLLHLQGLGLVGQEVTFTGKSFEPLVKGLLLHSHCLKLVLKLLNDGAVDFFLFLKSLGMLLLALARIKTKDILKSITVDRTKKNLIQNINSRCLSIP